ncbi:hypothetical protein [Cellulomonas massiliensis]|uniref:hypothetical protein n=1 Tax=Cellulomonas massiliensis TaxID=1465811 RepID=UPI0003200934|nr:hypothetical protein [Cellulomonas massiliensis]
MLTLRRTRGAAVPAGLLAGVLLALTAVVALAAPADAAKRCRLVQVTIGESVQWVERCEEDGDDGSGGSGGGGGPACELTGLASFCIGSSPCWMNYPAAIDPTPEEIAEKPSETAVWVYRRCNEDPDDPLSGWFWSEDVVPPIEVQAREAFGELVAPAFSVGTNPPGRSIVGLETWFWARTAQAGTITASSEFGVTAVAEPDHLEVDPGDGRAAVTCGWSTQEADTCALVYARSSAREQGQAYTARMRLVYDVHFENGGQVLDVAGVPEVFASPWQQASVPVAEIQAVTTS